MITSAVSNPATNDSDRALLQRDVDNFLANKWKIQRIPIGKSGIVEAPKKKIKGRGQSITISPARCG
jgi:hypothetical protein